MQQMQHSAFKYSKCSILFKKNALSAVERCDMRNKKFKEIALC